MNQNKLFDGMIDIIFDGVENLVTWGLFFKNPEIN